MDLLKDLEFRGITKQLTDPDLGAHLGRGPITLYAGFDPTSDSLHVGSLLPLMTLLRFQRAGHKPIAVIGGATGMVGDPSGKSQERTLLDDAALAKNLAGIRSTIERFLDFTGPGAARIENNADWFQGMNYLRFLRDVGKHFTVNHMMAKESVRARLEDREHGISYTEFSYMLVQAYDFQVLNQKHGCTLQIGGSDQWGNITAGIELIRRMGNPAAPTKVYGLTHPLVMKADGGKFGKTEEGTVWLDPAKTSPYQFYQFFVQTADADVGTYLRFFTLLTPAEILELERLVQTAPERREAQKALARAVTSLVHGQAAVNQAEGATAALFGEEIKTLSESALLAAFASAPTTEKPRTSLNGPLSLVDLLVETTLASSKGAARKEIQGGGIYVNNVRASEVAATLSEKDLIAGGLVVLRKGKRTYHLVRFTNWPT